MFIKVFFRILFLAILLGSSFAASLFMTLEAESFFSRFYPTENGINYALWAAALNEIFLVILAATWLPKTGTGNQRGFHPGNILIKLLVIFLFINTVGGASLNVIGLKLEKIQEQENQLSVLKIRQSQVEDQKENLKAFIDQNQRVNTVMTTREINEIKNQIAELESKKQSTPFIWLEILLIFLVRFAIQSANMTTVWLAGWLYRQPLNSGGIFHSAMSSSSNFSVASSEPPDKPDPDLSTPNAPEKLPSSNKEPLALKQNTESVSQENQTKETLGADFDRIKKSEPKPPQANTIEKSSTSPEAKKTPVAQKRKTPVARSSGKPHPLPSTGQISIPKKENSKQELPKNTTPKKMPETLQTKPEEATEPPSPKKNPETLISDSELQIPNNSESGISKSNFREPEVETGIEETEESSPVVDEETLFETKENLRELMQKLSNEEMRRKVLRDFGLHPRTYEELLRAEEIQNEADWKTLKSFCKYLNRLSEREQYM